MSGQTGAGLRIGAEELSAFFFGLTNKMRDTQRSIILFNQNGLALDFNDFSDTTLTGRVKTSGISNKLLSWGITDNKQGMLYLLQDGNQSLGTVQNAQLEITDLPSGQIFNIEFWQTQGSATAPISSLSNQQVIKRSLKMTLPAFTEDIALKFKSDSVASNLLRTNQLFNWAEQNFSDLFNGQMETFEILGFLARGPYQPNNNYMGTKDGRVYVLGDILGFAEIGSLQVIYESIE
jgi:hypothetical protein